MARWATNKQTKAHVCFEEKRESASQIMRHKRKQKLHKATKTVITDKPNPSNCRQNSDSHMNLHQNGPPSAQQTTLWQTHTQTNTKAHTCTRVGVRRQTSTAATDYESKSEGKGMENQAKTGNNGGARASRIKQRKSRVYKANKARLRRG